MLTPDELKVVPDNIVKIYQDLEDDIISDIARRLQKAGEITDTADWQMYMLGQMGNDLEEIKSKIAKTNKMSKDEVDKLFINATDRSMYYENIAYKKAGKKILSLYDSPTMMRFVEANAKKTHGELKNLTKSLGFKSGNGFKSVAKTYQDTLNYAHFQVASGAFSYQDAVRNAVRTLTESGLRVVDYESGVSNMLDVAVRRATLTGINQTVSEMTLMQMKESDSEFVEVTAHMGARPDHQTWQGKVYHVGGDKDGYPDFEESTGYGTGAGLCGWNCRHSFFVFFPGISVRNYTDEQLKNIDPPPIEYDGKTYTYYEATQKQRQIERMIRKTKRELVALDSAGLKSDFTAKSVRLRKQKDLYVDFSKYAKLKTRNERHQVYGFNKSVSNKSSWANRKNIDKNKDIVDKTLNKGYNKTKVDNMYPNQVAGVKRGKPMTFEEANQLKSNPNFKNAKEYRNNCQTCVVSHEARIRGYDVEAKGNTTGSVSEMLSKNTNKAWIDPKTGKNPDYIFERKDFNPTSYMKYLDDNLEKNKRYTVEFQWKKIKSGHIVIIEKLEDNTIRMYDPQSGEIFKDKEIANYFKNVKFGFTTYGNKFFTPPKLLNVSDMEFNLDVVHKILRRATT